MSAQGLTNEQFAELFELIQGADTVELKLTVPDGDHRSAVSALEIDPLDAQIRQVVFFDTPDLQLNNAGVVVRARRVQDEAGDSVIKLRPVVPRELPAELRQSPAFGVEVDAMPGAFVCSGSMKGQLNNADVSDGPAGRAADQEALHQGAAGLLRRARPGGLDLDSLTPLGPIFLLKLKFAPEASRAGWSPRCGSIPTAAAILELSTKCLPGEAFQVGGRDAGVPRQQGINLSGEQQTKTRTALDYFSHLLTDAPPEQ